MEKKKLIVSFSGGRTSAYMTKWLIENAQDKYDIQVVFSNTGRELEQTLEFVRKCDNQLKFNTTWIVPVVQPEHGKGIRSKVVDFESCPRNGEPFEAVIAKYSIPNRTSPFCSEYMKKYAIKAYVRDVLAWRDYHTAIGIRTDEIDRVSTNRKKEKLIYPLIEMHPTSKSDVNRFWLGMPFDLELKSYEGNCATCWKKSLRKLLTIAKHHPERFEWDIEMERKYEDYVPESRKRNKNIKPPLRFHRGNLSAKDIVEMSKQPFEEARDDSKDVDLYRQTRLFGYDLDVSNGCSESCEAF